MSSIKSQPGSGARSGSNSLEGSTAIERQLSKMGQPASHQSAPEPEVLEASADVDHDLHTDAASSDFPDTAGADFRTETKRALDSQDDANANVTPLPLPALPRVTPTGRKLRLQALSSIQELIAARKKLLIGFYGNRPYSDELRTEVQTILSDQQTFWEQLARKRTIYEQDVQLFDNLGEALRQHLDHAQQHGSFEQHLHLCAEVGNERHLLLISALNTRLEAASLLNEDEVPLAVTASAKALRMQEPGSALAQQLVNQLVDQGGDVAEEPPTLLVENDTTVLTSPSEINAQRENLLARMEDLTQRDLDPRERARQVKILRSEWDAMNRANSKYLASLAQRFEQVGQQAYEPSRQYYAALAEKLARNLNKRLALATSLRNYYTETDWNKVDWKNVESTLVAARHQWKEYAPTERKKTHPVKRLFETSYRNIDELLQREYDQNAQQAQKLVELMTNLGRQKASSASSVATMDALRRWKNIGRMRTADRNELKKQMAEGAAIVRQNRKKQLSQLRELRARRMDALSLIQQLSLLLSKDGDDLLNHVHDATLIKDQFNALTANLMGMPLDRQQAATVQNLSLAFNDQYTALEQKMEHVMLKRSADALDAYQEASRLISNAEFAHVNGVERDEVTAASELASDYLGDVRFLPKGGHGLLTNRLNYLHYPKD